ncbi:MAG: GTP-binding protein [Lewinellaceae bacterium]|nr:GTP-binding protein [Lewinellaceae bacterium]
MEVPPYEIVQNGNDPIIRYFEEIRVKGGIENNEIKLILVGNSTAGKTSLVNFLIKRQYKKGEITTHGITRTYWQPEGKNMLVSIWDFGGQEYYHAIHKLFLSCNAVYILVCDAENNQHGEMELPVYYQAGVEARKHWRCFRMNIGLTLSDTQPEKPHHSYSE